MEKEMTKTSATSIDLVNDLRKIIDSTRQRVAVGVNAELTLMYWHIGERINRDVLGNERAMYGKQIVTQVAKQLQEIYGNGFEERTVRRMMRFAQIFPDIQILSPWCQNYHGLIF